MLTKYAVTSIESASLVTPEMALGSETNMAHFKELVAELKKAGQSADKKVAPRSDEFVYFVCRAIHAMEAANYDPVTKSFTGDGYIIRRGNDGKDQHGNPVEQWQDGLWYSASDISPYINQNGDAFPEEELLADVVNDKGDKIKAYESFIGRGLFVNHASDDAEKIRGIILDARWDSGTKGVDILVACDKVAYPELARQIEMGYSNDVSMGTQVQYSLCSKCGNKAVTEADYCDHVKNGKGLTQAGGTPTYEINNGLNFIEISVVSNGADPKAKIKTVLAALSKQVQEREAKLNSCINPIEAEKLRDELRAIQAQVDGLLEKKADLFTEDELRAKAQEFKGNNPEEYAEFMKRHEEAFGKEASSCSCGCGGSCDGSCHATSQGDLQSRREARYRIANELGLSLSEEEGNIALYNKDNGTIIEGGFDMTRSKKAYFQGGGGLNDPSSTPYDKEDYTSVRDNEDKHMVGQGMEPGNDGLHPGYDSHPTKPELRWKEELLRADVAKRREIRKAMLAQAYFQGGGGLNDPSSTPYDKEDYTSVRDNEDKQMVGQGMEPGNDGLHPGYDSHPTKPELRWKEELLRAKLRAKFITAGTKGQSTWTLYASETPILTATAEELYPGDLEAKNDDNPEITNWDWVASKEYGQNLIKAVKELGFDEVKAQFDNAKRMSKTAQELPALDSAPDAGPMPDLGAPEGDLGAPEGEDLEGGEGEMSEKEQISAALGSIEDAVREIRALNEGEEGSVDSLETELDLGEAGAELEGLGEKLEEASTDSELQKKLSVVVREALKDADKLLLRVASLTGKPSTPTVKRAGAEDLEEAKKDLESAEHELSEVEAKDDGEKKEAEAESEAEEEGEKKEANLIARKAARYKLAQELYNLTDGDMIDEAHPEGGTDTKAGEQDLEGDAHVETEKEQQAADEEVAEKQPRGELSARQQRRLKMILAADDDKDEKADKDEKPDFADLDKDGNEEESAKDAADDAKDDDKDDDKDDGKKEAAKKCPTCGKTDCGCKANKMSMNDRRRLRHKAVAGLMSSAEVDGETKSYYSELFNESALGNQSDPACKQFGSELTQDFVSEKKTAATHELKTRMKRAYKVAMKQAQIGQIEDSQESLESQVDRLMSMDDAGFEAFEDVVENTSVVKDAKVERTGLKKSAGAVRVGMVEPNHQSMAEQLSKLDWS